MIMEFIGALFAFFFAVMLTAVYKLAFRNILGGFWAFFILMFFISLAAGEWAAHRGPAYLGYYWLPGLIAAIVVALVIATVSTKSDLSGKAKSGERTRKIAGKQASDQEVLVSAAVLGIFFWILIAILILVTIAGLVSRL